MKDTINAAKEKMTKSLNALGNEFASIRAGRANPAVLDKVLVDYYGSPTPVNQMAAISVAEARILVIQPWDKSSLKLIEKAILASDIGITPTNDGTAIRLVFPQLTEDRSIPFIFSNILLQGFSGGSAVKNRPPIQEMQVLPLGQENPLEKAMATHSSTLAWKIPWTEEPGMLQSMGLLRVRHD